MELVSDKTPFNPTVIEAACTPLVEVIQQGNITTILDGIKGHDDYTFAHSMRVAAMLVLFGKHL